MNYVGLTVTEFVEILENINTSKTSTGTLIYWFHDRQTKKNIMTPKEGEKNYYRVTYREIVLISQIFLDQLKNDHEKANKVANSLQLMTERKLSHKSPWNPLRFNAYEFLQCCYYYNEGGFQPSTSIANQLIRTLKQVPKNEKDTQENPQTPVLENLENSILPKKETKSQTNKEPPKSGQPNQRQSTRKVVIEKPLNIGEIKQNEPPESAQRNQTNQQPIKRDSLILLKQKYAYSCSNLGNGTTPQVYTPKKPITRHSSFNCLSVYQTEEMSNNFLCSQVFDKLKVFDLKTSKEQGILTLNKIRCLVDYLRYLSDSYTIDLDNTICKKLILDALKYYSVDNQLTLINWLILQEGLSVELICLCAERIVYRYKNLSQTNSFAAIKLLEIYQKKFDDIDSEFDSRILNLAAIMISNPERDSDKTLENFINWITKQNKFNFETFDILIDAFVDKGIHDSNTNGITLINKLKSQPLWIKNYQKLEHNSVKNEFFKRQGILI